MPTRISSTRNRSTRVEPLGPSLVLFDRGIADLEGAVRPGVLEAARRKGYRISDDDPATPAPKRRTRKPRAATTAPDAAGEDLAVVETADGVEHVGTLPASAAEPAP